MTSEQTAPPGPSLPARILIGAVAALVVIMLVQWVLAAVLGAIRFALFVVVLVAAAFWVVSAKAKR